MIKKYICLNSKYENLKYNFNDSVIINEKELLKNKFSNLSNNDINFFQNNIKALENIKKNKDKIGLIINNSFENNQNLEQKISEILENIPNDFDLMFIGNFLKKEKFNFYRKHGLIKNDIPNNNYFKSNIDKINDIDNIKDTDIYLISYSFAKKILKYFDKMVNFPFKYNEFLYAISKDKNIYWTKDSLNNKKTFSKNLLILSNNKELFETTKYKTVIRNLIRKGYNIEIKFNDNYNENLYDYIFTNDNNNNKNHIYYSNIQNIIKKLLSFQNSLLDKMFILDKLYEGMNVILFASGPSVNDCDFKILKEKQNEYVIIPIKSTIDILNKHNITPDYCLFSHWMNSIRHIFTPEYIKSNYGDNIILYMNQVNNMNNQLFDINLKPNYRFNWELTMEHLKKNEDLNYLKYNMLEIQNNFLFVRLGHIMLEMGLPFSQFLGCKNIYTFGWDGTSGKKNDKYFDGREVSIDYKRQTHEFEIMKSLQNAFAKEGIKLFKCSPNSPNEIEYKPI